MPLFFFIFAAKKWAEKWPKSGQKVANWPKSGQNLIFFEVPLIKVDTNFCKNGQKNGQLARLWPKLCTIFGHEKVKKWPKNGQKWAKMGFFGQKLAIFCYFCRLVAKTLHYLLLLYKKKKKKKNRNYADFWPF